MLKSKKRSYVLPGKLILAMERLSDRCGWSLERMAVAGILRFVDSTTNEQYAMLERVVDYTESTSHD